ncbi:unnamed protein product [Soboliphyme baturini]|uniref:G_PROTEIN_RECEP_F1_2 domain-containing protein n=1 Tax=Soboliphyme baturini TaxID=241478 RepID=A0A183ICM8_9BILA|nr:unnamed protein product [Soboliphyme baturini]
MDLDSCFEKELSLDCFTSLNYSTVVERTEGNRIAEQQWNDIVARIDYEKRLNDNVENVIICCISLLGINGAIWAILTLHQRSYRERRIFFLLMNAGCAADLAFNIIALPLYYLRTVGYRHAKRSLILLELICIGRPLIYTLSQFSDFTVVLLALERYLSLCHLTYRHSVSSRRKTCHFMAALLPALLISCVRFYYIKQYAVIRVGEGETVTYDLQTDPFAETWYFITLCLFNDGVVPLVMIIATTYFTVSIVRVVHRRSAALQMSMKMGLFDGSSKALGHPVSGMEYTVSKLVQKQEKLNRNRNMIALILITSFGFYVNQTINMATTGIMVWETLTGKVTMCNSEKKIRDWLEGALRMLAVDTALNIFDSLSHSMNFYAYLALNRTFRNELVAMLLRVRTVRRFCVGLYDWNK